MIHEIPLLRSLDPHHSRLGYLGALSAVSLRALDTYDALVARYRDLLFERFYPEDERFNRAIDLAGASVRDELRRRTIRSDDENPAAILAPPNRSTGWITRSEAWLYHESMPSHVGYLMPKHAGRTVDLARWTGVLLPTLELSETGFLLQLLATGGADGWNRDRNLLNVQARPALRLLYWRLLLGAELLLPNLVCEFVDRQVEGRPLATRGDDGLLRAAVARLIEALGEPEGPEDILAFRELREFSDAVLKTGSTEDNYLRPRLEMLVDLGLVRRRTTISDKSGVFLWEIAGESLSQSNAWNRLAQRPQMIDDFLERDFVGAVAPACGLTVRQIGGDAEALLWFVRAYQQVRREIGFTPGRTVAQLASLMAAEAEVRLEVAEIFRAVYAVPAGPFAEYISFSGGSRFDNEFMIKIHGDALKVLEASIVTMGRKDEDDG